MTVRNLTNLHYDPRQAWLGREAPFSAAFVNSLSSDGGSDQRCSDNQERRNNAGGAHSPYRTISLRLAPVDLIDICAQALLSHLVDGNRIHVIRGKHRFFSVSRLLLLHFSLERHRKRPRTRAVKKMQNRQQEVATLLQVCLFGVPVFLRADNEAVVLRGRKDQALLAYLATNAGISLARDRLVELIWPDAAEGAGRASLRQSLSTIRKALGAESGALISSDRNTVMLGKVGLATDVATLEALAAEPKAGAAQTVRRGEFLEGLSGISPGFDSWRATEHARLSALASHVLCERAEKAETERRFADAAALLMQALAVDPLAEATYRRLMRVEAAQGRANSALRQFRSLEVLLETELGVRPEKETLELVREIRAARQTGESSPAPKPPTEAEIGCAIGRPALLVAPFTEAGAAEEYFADSFTESVIIALARFHETPVLDLKSTRIAASAHGEEAADMVSALGARYVLSGTIRRGDTRLRVNVRLTDGATGRTVWAQGYDRETRDLFEVEDELSAHVATAIAGRIEDEDQRRAHSKRESDLEVVDLVMRGRYELNKYTKAGEEAARRHFSAALARDPDCVAAIAGLAISHIHEFEGTWPKDPDRNLAEAQRLAERAVALDEDDAHARYALASAVFYRGGFDLAIQHCNRALEINPNDYHNLCSQGWFLTFNGEVEAGLACNAKALSLNPYAPNGCLMVAGFGKIIRDDPDGAIPTLAAIRSENMFKQGGLAACYASLGRVREAELAAETFRRLAEEDFPGDAQDGFSRTSNYWRRMFRFARAEDEECFFGALNRAGVPV